MFHLPSARSPSDEVPRVVPPGWNGPPCGLHLFGPVRSPFLFAPARGRSLCDPPRGESPPPRSCGCAEVTVDFWDTPLGRVGIERKLGEHLKEKVSIVVEDDSAHLEEHSIEVQLPFLQTVLGEFSCLPISLSYLNEEECARLGQAIADLYDSQPAGVKRVLIVASSDLNHYLPPQDTERLDRLALEKVLDLDPSGLIHTVQEHDISMCGVYPTAVFLYAAKALGATRARLLKHCHSGDAVPMDQVVGYASEAVEREAL